MAWKTILIKELHITTVTYTLRERTTILYSTVAPPRWIQNGKISIFLGFTVLPAFQIRSRSLEPKLKFPYCHDLGQTSTIDLAVGAISTRPSIERLRGRAIRSDSLSSSNDNTVSTSFYCHLTGCSDFMQLTEGKHRAVWLVAYPGTNHHHLNFQSISTDGETCSVAASWTSLTHRFDILQLLR